ncbi:hypothetical protein FRC07_005876 [Ceratobasidium sp. 392]|nr:hypothetical protein FRC07_005876 [Ceratobasidium sp. 392]
METSQETQRTQIDTQRSQYELEDTSHLNARLISRNPMYPNIDLGKGTTTYTVGRKARVNNIVMPQEWKRINIKSMPQKEILYLDPDPIIWVNDLSQSGTYINGQRVGENNHILHVGEEICFGKPSQNDPAENHCELSSGTFGVVYKVLDKEISGWAAMKVILTDQNLHNPQALEREVTIHSDLNHENIIRLFTHYEEPGRLFMELAEYGDLQGYLKHYGPLSESQTRDIAWQVYQAVAYTHSRQVTHRDLKPENILLTSMEPLVVKIADFGLAKAVDGQTFLKTFCGTQNYVAPEILQGASGYGQMVDIYSLGVIFLFCMTGRWVFDNDALAILRNSKVSENGQPPRYYSLCWLV